MMAFRFVRAREEQHVFDHARQALIFVDARFDHVAVLVGRARLRQRDLRVGRLVWLSRPVMRRT
ncbi:hypothetical protein [Burkholderia mayonis]|uniref:hypothetical protein n=1 Tax=Burkholderia mayonis TaxID=1385591 RepID=UPI003AAA79EC